MLDAAWLLARVRDLEAALRELDDWASRMPDAGFTDQSPRWLWWHERPRRARAVLAGETAGEEPGTCECGAPPRAMHYHGCPYLPEGHPGATPGEPPVYAPSAVSSPGRSDR